MPAAYAQSDQFRGARIHLCDLAGLEIRDCEVSGLKIVDCYGGDVYLGGAFERLVVNAVLEEDATYPPLGLPYGGMPPDAAAKLGLTLEATPTLDEVLAPRLARMATMRRVVDGLTEAELDRVCGRKPADPYPDREYVVRRCLKVVLKEEAEHHRYAARDLAVLEAGA